MSTFEDHTGIDEIWNMTYNITIAYISGENKCAHWNIYECINKFGDDGGDDGEFQQFTKEAKITHDYK